MKNVVTIGGGNGQPITLKALCKLDDLNIKAIVTMLDDGGSTGRLCREHDILPPGDLMKCQVALSNYNLKDLFIKRFSSPGVLNGHSVGNMLLTKLITYTGSFESAIEALSKILDLKGEVVPVITKKAKLVAKYTDGQEVRGEYVIDVSEHCDENVVIDDMWIEPKIKANPRAIKSIKEADYIILGPGDLYTSVLANVAVLQIRNAIKNAKGRIIFVANLMTKRGQISKEMGISKVVLRMEKFMKRKLDFIIINNSKIKPGIVGHYRYFGENLIRDDLKKSSIKIIRADVVNNIFRKQDKNDKIRRSVLTHCPNKLSVVLRKIIK